MIPPEDELERAAITVLAAWRNGLPVVGDDAPKLLPAHIPHRLCRALWRAIRLHVPFAAHRHYHNIIVYAKEAEHAPDAEWAALWARIEGARDAADDAEFRRCAQVLIAHHARIEKEKSDAWGEQFEERLKERFRVEKERLEQKPGFTRQDLIDTVYHGHDPASEGVPRDLLSFAAAQPDGREARIPPVQIYPDLEGNPVSSRPRFDLKSAAAMLLPVPPMRWLVDKLLIPGGRSIVFGKPGSKKTYLLMWLAVCLALGRDFLGLKTEQTNVLFVDEESGELRMHYRLHELLLGAGAGPQTPLWHIPPCGFLITDPEDRHELRRIILGEGIGFVVIDSLARVSSGDENSKKDMQRVTDGQDELAAETGAHIALIHHTPKSENSDTPRGSGVFEASPDLLLGVKSAKGSPFVNIWTEKIRDAVTRQLAARCEWFTHPSDPNLNTFRMQAAEVRETKEEGRKEAGLSPSEAYVVRFVREHPECTRQQIMDAADVCSSKSASNALYSLIGRGLVKRTNPEVGGQGGSARFRLTQEQQEQEDDE
jgi:hypothetical protein